jgi:hypothetical protein
MWFAGRCGVVWSGSGYLTAAARRAGGPGCRALGAPDLRQGQGAAVGQGKQPLRAPGAGVPPLSRQRPDPPGLTIAPLRRPSAIRQALRTLRGRRTPGKPHRTVKHLGNVPTDASFSAVGSFPSPHPSCETPRSTFLSPRLGRYTAQSVRNLTLGGHWVRRDRPRASGARARRTDRPRSPTAHACTHAPPDEAAQITPNHPLHRGCVPQGPLSDTNPEHPPDPSAVS